MLIVHGVGEQRKSDTLLYIGSPLLAWVSRWAQRFYGRPSVDIGPVELSFVPYDVGQGDQPAFAAVHLPEQTWYFAEAWWAGSSFHPDLKTMLYWSFVHLFDILAQMLRNTALRLERTRHPRPRNESSQPPPFWQWVDLFNCLVVAVLYAIGLAVGYVLLVPLMVLAQIPIDGLQDFILFKLLQPVLTAGAGEFRMFLDDELQAANVRHRVAAAARTLLERAECDELIILAHSEGCVVSLGMLTDPEFADVARRTRKLFTFGAGLNKSWLIKPTLDRLFTPLEGDTLWTDFWASYDPVPAGPLDPSRRRGPDGKPLRINDLYVPSGDALAQVGAGNPPIDEQVTNNMNVVTDHGGYFVNDEQVLVRMAAEISAPHHADSAFWPELPVLLDGVRRRRIRVCALALWRDVAVAIWAIVAVVPWLTGWLRGVDPWQSLASVAPAAIGPAAGLLSALMFVRDGLPALFAPIAGVAAMLLNLPSLVGLAAIVGVVMWGVYSVVQWQWWQRWDTSESDAFLNACVESSQQRLKATAPAGSPVSP